MRALITGWFRPGFPLRQRGGIPHLDRVVFAGRDDSVSIQAEDHAGDRVIAPLEHEHGVAAGGVPEPNAPVFPGRCHPMPVRTVGHADDSTVMPLELLNQAAVGRAQNADGPGETGRGHPRRVGVQSDGQILLAEWREMRLAGRGVTEAHVSAGRRDFTSITAEGDRQHWGAPALQGENGGAKAAPPVVPLEAAEIRLTRRRQRRLEHLAAVTNAVGLPRRLGSGQTRRIHCVPQRILRRPEALVSPRRLQSSPALGPTSPRELDGHDGRHHRDRQEQQEGQGRLTRQPGVAPAKAHEPLDRLRPTRCNRPILQKAMQVVGHRPG